MASHKPAAGYLPGLLERRQAVSDQTVQQQPLYADGWYANQPHMRRPGESDDEFFRRQLRQARELLAERPVHIAPKGDV